MLLSLLFRTVLQNEKLQETRNLSDWVETQNCKLNSSGKFHFDQWQRYPPDLITGIQTIAFCLNERKPIEITIWNTAQTDRHTVTPRSTKCSQKICYGNLSWDTFPICILILSYHLRCNTPSSFLSLKFSYKLYIYIYFSLLNLTACVNILHLMTIMLLGATCTLCAILCPLVVFNFLGPNQNGCTVCWTWLRPLSAVCSPNDAVQIPSREPKDT